MGERFGEAGVHHLQQEIGDARGRDLLESTQIFEAYRRGGFKFLDMQAPFSIDPPGSMLSGTASSHNRMSRQACRSAAIPPAAMAQRDTAAFRDGYCRNSACFRSP